MRLLGRHRLSLSGLHVTELPVCAQSAQHRLSHPQTLAATSKRATAATERAVATLTPIVEEEGAEAVVGQKAVVVARATPVVVEAREPKVAKAPGDQLMRISLTVGLVTSFSEVSVTRGRRANTRTNPSSQSSQARTTIVMMT